MKNLIGILALALIMVTASSCRKQRGCTQINAVNYSRVAEQDDGSCYYDNGNNGNNGNGGNTQATTASVWTNGSRQIYVWIGYIDSNNISGQRNTAPMCNNESGCFHTAKVVEGGTYDLYAQSNDGNVWRQTITIAKGCNTYLLDQSGLHKKDLDSAGYTIPMQPMPSIVDMRRR
ncbi:MAG: hypothetical protein WCG20_01750 [bacterium]